LIPIVVYDFAECKSFRYEIQDFFLGLY